jgi:hypothetical protein
LRGEEGTGGGVVGKGEGLLQGRLRDGGVLPGIRIGAVPRGPLLFDDRPGAAEQVVRETLATARRLGIRLLVVQPPEGSAALDEALGAAGFRVGAPAVAPTAPPWLSAVAEPVIAPAVVAADAPPPPAAPVVVAVVLLP